MRILRKIKYKKFVIRSLILSFFLLAVLYGLSDRFLANASISKVNLYPDTFNTGVADGQKNNLWRNLAQILLHDLSPEDSYSSFSEKNSAYIIFDKQNNFDSPESSSSTPIKKPLEGSVLGAEASSSPAKSASSSSKDFVEFTATTSIEKIIATSSSTLQPLSSKTPQKASVTEAEKDTAPKSPDQPEKSLPQEDSQTKETEQTFDNGDPEQDKNASYSQKEVLGDESSQKDGEEEIIKNKEPAQKEQSVESEGSPVQKDKTEKKDGTLGVLMQGFDSLAGHFRLGPAKAQDEVPELSESFSGASLLLSGFSLPSDFSKEKAVQAYLNLSMAAFSQKNSDRLLFEYSFNGTEWFEISSLAIDKKVSNKQNGSYFSFDLPIIENIENLSDLNIKITFLSDDYSPEREESLSVYIDSAWIELNYGEESILEKIKKNPGKKLAEEDRETERTISIKEEKKYFSRSEKPNFSFQYKKSSRGILAKLKEGIGSIFSDQYKKIDIQAELMDAEGGVMDYEPEVIKGDDGNFEVLVGKKLREFKPGKYSLKVMVDDENYLSDFTQDFTWGVLALNINKTIFEPKELAYFQMAVLDDEGHTICDADLYLEIETPAGEVIWLSTDNGLLKSNSLCGPDNIIDEPDYFAHYGLADSGLYHLKLSAETANGFYEISDQLEVKEDVSFDIERRGPTRIYPLADYEMSIRISPDSDFNGEFREYIPKSFKVKSLPAEARVLELENEKAIVWRAEWQKDESYELKYVFDAPDISPEFFLLGPAQVAAEKGNTVFKEKRQWQIASDAISSYNYDGGTSVNWTNAANAWDSTNNTYAYRDIPRRNVDDSANYLEGNSNTAPGDTSTINSVEIGIEGYVEDTGNVTAYILPRFGGSTDGTVQSISGATLGSSDSDTVYYVDITNDSQAPATWTWSDIQNLDVRVYGGNSNNGQPRHLYIDQISIRVDYTVPNDPPTGSFNSASQKIDGSGVLDISIEIDDPDDNDTSAMIEYESGATCTFASPLDPTLSEVDGDTTADFGDPNVLNSNTYQIGNATGWIETASGSNTVLFDWNSETDLPTGDGTYCLRLTANDGTVDQSTPDTQTVTIDNVDPTTPGDLSVSSVAGTSVTFNFGSASSDTNFDKYIIYYREGASGATTTDSSYTNTDMDLANYNGASTVTVPGLFPDTQYVFNIWAYDDYGNLTAALNEVSTTTASQLVPPISSINSVAQKTDGSGVIDFSVEFDDGNDDDVRARVDYVAGTTCDFSTPLDPELDENASNISADFGSVIIDNTSIYQIGTSTGLIETASGSNTVLFDWFSKDNLPAADGAYCIQITANDFSEDQNTPATSTLIIDNVNPTDPGTLNFSTSSDTSITLSLGSQSSDTNFDRYRIFYKKALSGVTETDSEHTDNNLNFVDYNSATTTKVKNLEPETDYVFNIWAYDDYGNKASSSEVSYSTQEARPRRANTVTYTAGLSYGNGTSGENTDSDLNFPAFNWRLGEKDVEIKNAFIVFEAMFEAYGNNTGNYTGYNLAFDTCAEPCTADAFNGTNQVLKDDNTVLVYDETESNQVRLLFDVTNEAQLAAYTGEGDNMEAQVGYRMERGSSANSISYANARLVVTYVYDSSISPNITNTVYYPLDSTATGDSGSRLSLQTNGCTLDSDCPTFSYQMDIPEYGSSISDWFYGLTSNDIGNPNRDEYFSFDVNVESTDINSDSIIHEISNAGGQSSPLPYYFSSVPGLSPNTAQSLEMHLDSVRDYDYYLLGGEAAMTYLASSSAGIKTRTASFPLGVVNNGATTALTNSSVDVYFPENGASSGVVSVKDAWIRILSSNYSSGANSVTVSTQVGNNTQSGNYAYNYDQASTVISPDLEIIHIIPSSDYAELALANGVNPKTVTLNTTNSSVGQGGLSAELLVTYTYSDESNGYLSTLDLYAGQSGVDADSQLATSSVSGIVTPEIVGSKTIRGAGMETSYLINDSSGSVTSGNATVDASIGTTTPTCNNAYQIGVDSNNSFSRFYNNVSSLISPVNNTEHISCYSNNGSGSGTGGAKMNSILSYTYQYIPPPPEFRQNDWRWYENIDAVVPTSSLASENEAINQVYLADNLRLRINVEVSKEDLATSSESFKLQYAKAPDCTATNTWSDVGAIGSGSAWEGYNNPTVSDGSGVSSLLLASSSVAETYEEENPSATIINTVPSGEQAEWDWVLYNNNASSSANYCFRMIKSDDSVFENYNNDSYPQLTTAPANTAPSSPNNLAQYRDDEITVINNQNWIDEDAVKLVSEATDPDVNEIVTLYYEVIDNASSFTTATSQPSGACVYGTAYASCASQIWYVATSSPDFFRYESYRGTSSITAIPDGSYKWQVIACDDDAECSDWVRPGANPNFKIDTVSPTAPGPLDDLSVTPTSISVAFGASTTELNFLEYRIFYKEGLSGVTENDNEYLNPVILDYQNYNGATSTLIDSLSAGTDYVINIWAYDKAGNKASSTLELATTTSSSFTPPTGNLVSSVQKIDGTGAVDILMSADDPDNDNTLRAKIEYVAGTDCDFTSPNKATLDPRDDYTSADYGDPVVDNAEEYQLGSSTGWIWTSPGENYVSFDWLAKTDVPGVEGTYCLRSTINDGVYDQDTSDTKLVLLDTVNPTVPGALSLAEKGTDYFTLNFGAQSIENNFDRYRIYYSTSSPVTEADTEHSDANLLSIDYNSAATTTISGLEAGVTYYINIWAYDDNGNKASSTPLAVATNYLPNNLTVGNQYRADNQSLITNGSWINSDDVYLSASVNDQDSSEILSLYFELILASSTFTTATSEPTGACVWGADYSACASKIWFVSSSSPDNYSVTPFSATTSINNIPDSSEGYKWQVLACDDDGGCVNSWEKFNTSIPNFKVDDTPPSAPGALIESSKNSSNITMTFGTSTDEINFDRYRIYYSTSSPVTESDIEHSDANLLFKDYNEVSITTVSELLSDTQYYFNIWAYDLAGNKASSTETAITTDPISSTPGVFFYTKNDRTLYYKYWDGSAWSTEQTGPTMGSGAGDNIRHIDSIRSDDGARIAVLVKTWDGTNQEWWASVYKYAANSFVNTSQLGSSLSSATDADKITSCMASLSDGEFFVVRNNNGSSGTQVYSWNSSSGWSAEASGPDPGEILNGCRLVRRPQTDNYILVTFDNHYLRDQGHDYYGNVGTAYYYGGSSYADSWTNWTEHSQEEGELGNYVGEAFFNPTDNTEGAINYSNSDVAASAKAKYFVVTNNSINYGTEATSPVTWANAFVHGEFSSNPDSDGVSYFIGDDEGGEVNVYQVDISAGSPTWSTPTNSDNISGSNAYAYTNYAQKPYDLIFYDTDLAVALWNENTGATPKYRNLNASADSLDATDTSVPGAAAGTYSRVRTELDPNENEFVAIYQNSTTDYSAVFWDGFNGRFYNSTDNPGSNQIWTDIATSVTPSDFDDDAVSFSYAKRNSAPNTPTLLEQYKSDATTTIPNGAWSNTSDIYLEASANDPDTSEVITLYVELIPATSSYEISTQEPTGACVWGTAFNSCASKIWFMASSSPGDYSVDKFSDQLSITSVPDSASGYKWQVIACDDQAKCSNWVKYDLGSPHFKVDTVDPTAPGALTEQAKTSSSIILNFGAQTTELNFSEYKIFYSSSSPVTELDVEHTDPNLLSIDYNAASDTTIYNLDSNTTYYINIWAYDLAGNKASSTAVLVTTNQAPYLDQSSYLLENDDGADVNSNSSASAVDTSLSGVYIGERLNARLQLENTGGDDALNKTYKLQYENQTDNPGTWVDVGVATDIAYSAGLSGDNGDLITSAKAALNANTFTSGSWHEEAGQTGVFSLADGFYTEFVFTLETSNALAGKNYRLRLYNLTDDISLDAYSSYPNISIIATDSLRFSKEAVSSLTSGSADLLYYLDPQGYSDLSADDGSRDSLSTVSEYPVYNFVTANSNNTDAISVNWNGQSSVAASDADIVLQVYRFGSTNSWISIATNSLANANTDFNLNGSINSSLSEHYDGSNHTYWRVLQNIATTSTFNSDYFNATFQLASPDTKQNHFRFRNDDGTETTATWREDEDDGDPLTGTALEIGSTTRLRIEVANTGGGSASNYDYRIEYAYTTSGCGSDPGGWTTVPVNATTEEWEMSSSTYFNDGDSTTGQLTNSESYNFVSGAMVEDPSNSSGSITLTENDYTEIEYTIRATVDAVTAGTYCFRVTDSGSALDSYDIYPELTLAGISNSAPSFSVEPSDNNSATNTPTNYGEDVTFNATANDSELDDYYLAICKSDSIQPGNDAPPICQDGAWCVSPLASSTQEASCNYTTATSSESLDWYAFVCDKYPGVGNAKCSTSSQGVGDGRSDDSPFVINHPPAFNSISTLVDNQDPGSSFTITTNSSDPDTIGGEDTVSLYVCIGTSAGVAGCSGGPADTVCSYATTTDNVSCTFTDIAPTLQGDYSYNAFLFDSHGLAAVDNYRSNTYTINNVAPILGSLSLNGGTDVTLNLKGAGGTPVNTVLASVSDQNGCADGLVGASAAIYMSDVSGSYSCGPNDSVCYQINPTGCSKTGCTGNDDATASYTCSTTLKYFAVPTDDSENNPWSIYNWLSYISIYDGNSYVATTSAGVDFDTTIALNVGEDTIDFGSDLFVGDNTGTDNTTTTVSNLGNSPIDTSLSGTDMAGNPSGIIGVENIEWDLSNFTWSSGNNLSGIPTDVDIVAPNPVDATDIEDYFYWGIGIPFGSDASIYTGQNDFSVKLDADDWQLY